MRRLVLVLDGLPALREASASREVDLSAAIVLAELAGADAVRLGVNDDLRPVREEDLREARRTARRLELRMPPHQGLVKLALESRPGRVLLSAESRRGAPAMPLDLRGRTVALEPVVRGLAEAGIPTAALVAPDLEAVKRIHSEGVAAVEFHTGSIVDLPPDERRVELERLGDAVRLASKLRLPVGLGGGLDYRRLPEVIEACPVAEWVTVGRAAFARSLLVGLDRALRDLRALVS